jgi:gliding motility-associated lipoprotein GldH
MSHPYISILSVWKHLPFIFLLCLLFSSCDPNRIYEKNIRIDSNGWAIGEKVLFDVPVNDSLELYNFYINMRHTDNYKFSNLYLFINSYFPGGSFARDTIELVLADHTGKWYGKGLGKIKEYQVLIRKGIVFPVKGNYRISIEQGMRENNIKGIEDIGIRIERMNMK